MKQYFDNTFKIVTLIHKENLGIKDLFIFWNTVFSNKIKSELKEDYRKMLNMTKVNTKCNSICCLFQSYFKFSILKENQNIRSMPQRCDSKREFMTNHIYKESQFNCFGISSTIKTFLLFIRIHLYSHK